MKKIIILTGAVLMCGFTSAFSEEMSADQKVIYAKLDDFHDAAKNADKERYLGHFTADAVYMGTDEWERWPLKPDFTDYVGTRFDNGGWSYHSEERKIYVSEDGNFGWFDEIMISNSSGTRFRGSGVLRKENGQWKFTQYIQSFMVYNEVVDDVVKIIDAEKAKRGEN